MFSRIALPLILLVSLTSALPSYGMAHKSFPFLQKGDLKSVISTANDILKFIPYSELQRLTRGRFASPHVLRSDNPTDVLRAALLVGDVELARELLSKKFLISENPLVELEPDLTVLAALEGGSSEAIELLRDFGYFSSHPLRDQTSNQWYDWANEYRLKNPFGAQILIRGMLSLKAKPGDSILHQAVQRGQVEMAKLILLQDPSLLLRKNKYGQTPLQAAIHLSKKDLTKENLVEYLVSLQPVPGVSTPLYVQEGISLLGYAAATGNLERLIEYSKNDESQLSNIDKSDRRPIDYAVANYRIASVEYLLSKKPVDLARSVQLARTDGHWFLAAWLNKYTTAAPDRSITAYSPYARQMVKAIENNQYEQFLSLFRSHPEAYTEQAMRFATPMDFAASVKRLNFLLAGVILKPSAPIIAEPHPFIDELRSFRAFLQDLKAKNTNFLSQLNPPSRNFFSFFSEALRLSVIEPSDYEFLERSQRDGISLTQSVNLKYLLYMVSSFRVYPNSVDQLVKSSVLRRFLDENPGAEMWHGTTNWTVLHAAVKESDNEAVNFLLAINPILGQRLKEDAGQPASEISNLIVSLAYNFDSKLMRQSIDRLISIGRTDFKVVENFFSYNKVPQQKEFALQMLSQALEDRSIPEHTRTIMSRLRQTIAKSRSIREKVPFVELTPLNKNNIRSLSFEDQVKQFFVYAYIGKIDDVRWMAFENLNLLLAHLKEPLSVRSATLPAGATPTDAARAGGHEDLKEQIFHWHFLLPLLSPENGNESLVSLVEPADVNLIQKFLDTPNHATIEISASYTYLTAISRSLYKTKMEQPGTLQALTILSKWTALLAAQLPVEDSSSLPNSLALPALEAAPSTFSKQRSADLAPIAPSFLPENMRLLTMPKPMGGHARKMQTRIKFHQVVSTPDQIVEAIPIVTDQMRGRYYSLRKNLPLANERVTLILAGRGQDAFEPQETVGGRNILLLAGDQEGIAQALVGPRTDVYLIDALFFWNRSLRPEETKLFTTRRIAAFELAGALPTRKTIAVLDDNIEYILFNCGIDFKAEAERAWAHLYTDYMVRDLQTHNLAVIGLREESGKEKDTPHSQIILNRQSDSPVRSRGFGSKVFFFDFEEVKTSARGNFASLFPPLINMAQEDLYFQIYLKNAGKDVAHVDRRSIRFERHLLQARFAKRIAADVSTWSNDVLNLPGHAEDEARRLSTQALIKYAEEVIEDARQKKNRQLYTDLVKTQREAIAKNHSSKSSTSTSSSTSRKKRKATGAPLPPPPMDTYKGPTRFAEMDLDPAWAAFTQRLAEDPDHDSPKKLRPYQKEAFAKLSERLQAGERRGYFDMATGTGKTNIFMEIAKVANQELTGNVAIVLPNKAIKSQTYIKMKEFYEYLNSPVQFMSLSSQRDDVAGRTAAESAIVSQGKHILIFCEKTFPIFVRHRKGDLHDFSVLIFDEMHKLEWDSLELIAKFQKHPQGIVLGFSATPTLTQPFFGGEGGKIFEFRSVEGVRTFHEGRPILRPWEMRHIQGSPREGLIQRLPEILNTQDHPNGGKLSQRRGIIYISGAIAKAEEAAAKLSSAGLRASAYHSSLPEGKDAEILRDFESGKIQVLVAIYTLREGFDSENVDYVFMTQDKPKPDDVIQMRGRALRSDSQNPEKIALILTVNSRIAQQFSLTAEEQGQALSEETDNSDDLPIKRARIGVFPEEYEEIIEEGYSVPNSLSHHLAP